MFKIPERTAAFWAAKNRPRASASDIATIEELAGAKLPQSYVEFVTRYGFVIWNRDYPDTFDYSLSEEGVTEVYEGSIAFLNNVDRLEAMMDNVYEDSPEEGLPMIPRNVFPIANGYGQELVSIELEPSPGRIWYWPERQDPWGTGDNTQLGYAADDFYVFINGLRSSR